MYRVLMALVAMLSVSAVLLASAAFFVLQNLDQYRDELSARVGTLIGHPVSIGAAQVYWRGANPILRLEELHLLGHARYVERATMDRQRIVPLADVADDRAPYFSMIIAHRRGTAVTP